MYKRIHIIWEDKTIFGAYYNAEEATHVYVFRRALHENHQYAVESRTIVCGTDLPRRIYALVEETISSARIVYTETDPEECLRIYCETNSLEYYRHWVPINIL